MDIKSIWMRLAAVLSLLVGVTGAAHVHAQQVAQPPVVSEVDANGVNLADGTFQLPGLDIGIGANGSGIWRQTQGAADNFSASIGSTYVGGSYYGAPILVNVSYGGSVHRFILGTTGQYTNQYSSPYSNFGGAHAKLDCPSGIDTATTCTLVLDDGTRVIFTKPTPGNGWPPASSIIKADGEVITLTYGTDTSGNFLGLRSATSSLGWMLKYEYDSNRIVNKVTAVNTSVTYCDPAAITCAGASTSYPNATSSTAGGVTTIYRNGTPTLSYSVSGNVTTLSTPSGVTKTVTTTAGKVSQVTVGGANWNYSYVTDAYGNTTTTVQKPNGLSYSVKVSSDKFVTARVDESGRTTTYGYDSTTGALSSVRAPDGSIVQYYYDARNRLYMTRTYGIGGDPNFVGLAFLEMTGYPAEPCTNDLICNKPTSTIDANNVTTTYTYDSNGNLLAVTHPAVNGKSAQTRYSYTQVTPQVLNSSNVLVAQAPVWRLTGTSECMTADLNGCVTGAVTNLDERKSSISYGTNNLLPSGSTTARGDGSLAQTSTSVYSDNGQVLVSTGVKQTVADETYYIYDGLGRQTGVVGIDPDGAGPRPRRASRTHYDADGNVDQVDTGTVPTSVYSAGTALGRRSQAISDMASFTIQTSDTSHFNGNGQLDIMRHYDNGVLTHVTQRSYDSTGRMDCQAQRLNPAAFGSLPASACSLGTAGADGNDRIVKNNYDATTGVLSSTTTAYGTSLAAAEVTRVYDLSTATSTGNLLYVEDAKGNRTSYFYDIFNRLIKTCYPVAGTVHVSSTTDCEQITYLASIPHGAYNWSSTRVDHINRRDGQQINFTYDALGRLSSKSGAVNESYTYDNFSQVLTKTNNTTGGAAVTETYTYNSLGWLLSDAQPMGTMSYNYDAYGRRSRLTYPTAGASSLFVTYAYDDGDELTGIYENGTTSLLAGFDYDSYGRRANLYRGNGQTTTYNYDNNNVSHLLSMVHPVNTLNFTYTNSDQVKTKTYTNTGFNTGTSASTASNVINGLNQITTINTTTSIAYDVRGNLTSDGGGTYSYNANNLLTSATLSGVTSTLTYDAENRLFSIAKNGATTQFLYDGTDLVAEYDGAGGLLRRHVHGPGTDEPLVTYDGLGNKSWLNADDLGSIITITAASGTTTVNTYDAYGLPGSGNSGRFQYTGQTWLPEIGLFYYKARLYNPAIGRFMQTDPIGYGDGMNWYAYVHNDPINGKDPSGTQDTTGYDNIPVYAEGCFRRNGCWSAESLDRFGGLCGAFGIDCPRDQNITTPSDLVNRFLFSRPPPIFRSPEGQDCTQGAMADRASSALSKSATVHEGLEKGVELLDEGAGHALSHTTKILNWASAGAKYVSGRQNKEPFDVTLMRVAIPTVTSYVGAQLVGGITGGIGSAFGPEVGLPAKAAGGIAGTIGGDIVGNKLVDNYAASRGVGKCNVK